MKKHLIYIISLAILFPFSACSQSTIVESYQGSSDISLIDPINESVEITIIYDNYVHKEGMTAEWGYACYIDGLGKKILFDTGTQPEIFRNNFQLAGLKADEIDEVFISHEHGDHTGGLSELLKMSTDLTVVVPETFSNSFFRDVIKAGASISKIDQPVEICHNLYSTGVMGKAIPEQALVLNTSKGLVVMTGCSHPGIVGMLRDIKESFGKNIYMVFGGFHLMNESEEDINRIIKDMKGLGVIKCGATHCTGEMQTEMFRKAFGKDFVELGAGKVLLIN